MHRRHFVLAVISLPVLPRAALASPGRMTVYRSPTCGCCGAWVEHVLAAGYDVTTIEVDLAELQRVKQDNSVPDALASCHTAIIDDYAIEGHVPVEDITRLLAERPNALGLAVPGMPAGSPGMEMGAHRDAYDVMLFGADGLVNIFASHS